jgi:hypothetical protein
MAKGCDIVALFSGAHTSEIKPEMDIMTWDNIQSDCQMWLRIKEESVKDDFFCVRGGEVGAEHWHYEIESVRNTVDDIIRVRNYLKSQFRTTGPSVRSTIRLKNKPSRLSYIRS